MLRLTLVLAGAALLMQAPAHAAEIRWDNFGIPHIYGPDVTSVVRGLG